MRNGNRAGTACKIGLEKLYFWGHLSAYTSGLVFHCTRSNFLRLWYPSVPYWRRRFVSLTSSLSKAIDGLTSVWGRSFAGMRMHFTETDCLRLHQGFLRWEWMTGSQMCWVSANPARRLINRRRSWWKTGCWACHLISACAVLIRNTGSDFWSASCAPRGWGDGVFVKCASRATTAWTFSVKRLARSVVNLLVF